MANPSFALAHLGDIKELIGQLALTAEIIGIHHPNLYDHVAKLAYVAQCIGDSVDFAFEVLGEIHE